MEKICSSKKSVDFKQTTLCYIPEGSTLNVNMFRLQPSGMWHCVAQQICRQCVTSDSAREKKTRRSSHVTGVPVTIARWFALHKARQQSDLLHPSLWVHIIAHGTSSTSVFKYLPNYIISHSRQPRSEYSPPVRTSNFSCFMHFVKHWLKS
jgi:hypothetical protein